MRILITGSHGFIGQHLTRYLQSKNHYVIALDRRWFTDGYLEERMLDMKADIIIHLSSYGNMFDQKDEAETVQANVTNTLKLIESTRYLPYKAFIHTSTSSVHLPNQTLYSITKKMGEYLTDREYKLFKKPIVSVRPYSVYGPGEAEHRFIPTALRTILNNEPMKLSQGMHDWIYIDDVIDGYNFTIEHIDALSGKKLDIGTGSSVSNEEVVAILADFNGKRLSELPIEKVEQLRPFDTVNWKCKKGPIQWAGWTAKTVINEGLRSTYEAYREKIAPTLPQASSIAYR